MGGVLKRVFLGKVVSTRIPGRSFLRSWIKSGRFESKDGKDDPKVLKWLQLNRVCDSSHSCFFDFKKKRFLLSDVQVLYDKRNSQTSHQGTTFGRRLSFCGFNSCVSLANFLAP